MIWIVLFIISVLCDWLFIEPSQGIFLASPGLLLGLIGAGLSAGSSVASSLMNANAVSEANQSNLKAVRETNQQNKELFQQQLGFTEEMWNRANAYNSPSEQRRRLEDAGFNPYLALQAVQGAQASAATSPAANPMQAAQVQPVNYGSGMAEAVPVAFQTYFDNYLKSQQADAIGLDNRMKAVDASVKIQEKALELMDKAETIQNKKWISAKARQELRYIKEQIRNLMYENDSLRPFLSARNEKARNDALAAQQNAIKAEYEARYQKQLSEAFPKMNQAQLGLLASQMADAYASAGAHRAASRMYEAHAAEGWEKAKTEYNLRPYRVLVEKFNSLLAQGAAKLQDLGIPEAELKAMRDRDIIRQRKDGNFRFSDNAVYWFADKFATVFKSTRK